ncbi:hypothetical protein LSTR_LSTR001779 [Laodelphax striatellus]|uniref:SCP domain-containing protein n=1 Tax=Laodelphax striatellus TaxID=195883 RepID=A0A482WFJ5_LAOST|nr:hypothetical protein LSTR_LSTR001779 [Laodelphax striatellus]
MGLSTKIYSFLLIAILIIVSIVMTIIMKTIMDKLFGRHSFNGETQDKTARGKDIDVIVNTHNKLRATVALGQLQRQPPAQNMQKMTWDDQLASRAQYWAEQHMFKHDRDRDKNIGQNLYIVMFGGPHSNKRQHNFTEAITDWYEEHVHYTYKQLERGDSADRRTQTGHYTQVVWANTDKVGCGFASFYQTEMKQDQILYVCNYAPSGNYEEEYPYIAGKPNCKAHGMSYSDIDGLCRR